MKLFLRIFLSFWLAMILMIAAVLGLREVVPMTFPRDRDPRFSLERATAALVKVVDAYEQQGDAALTPELVNQEAIRQRDLVLVDAQGKALVGGQSSPPAYVALEREALEEGHVQLKRVGLRVVLVSPVQSTAGHHYAAILTIFEPGQRLFRPHFWFVVMLAMLPAALVCMALTLYLTRPITSLRAAAQRLASGDLGARARTGRGHRRDELGELARDFDTMAAQIELLMTAQRRFVADVSHELGAPLTRMHLALALLRRQLAGKNSGELARIERETDKLSNLVQQLLLLARLEAGSRPVEMLAQLSMRRLCESIAEDANVDAAHAGCRLTLALEDATVAGYPQLLRRAIENVVQNAIRYSAAGLEVELRCRVERASHSVVVEVLDRGPGVAEAMLQDIFRPFFRTAPGRESATGGTGLGLAIAKEAIEEHGGQIAASNREGGGLRVTMTLPMSDAPLEEEPRASEVEA
jgi:two-component system sensor histidine kinase CpxA